MFEQIYGVERCTPNMHSHGHIHECVLNYGPFSVFWLFPFERFNGILGNFHINKHDIEIQVMRKFLSGQQIRTAPLEEETHELNTLLQSAHQVKGSMLQTQLPSHM